MQMQRIQRSHKEHKYCKDYFFGKHHQSPFLEYLIITDSIEQFNEFGKFVDLYK